MNTLRALLLLGGLLSVVGCSDSVEDRYSTRAEAEADSLFQRGWLPAIIPASSRDIVTKNDLDINTSKGGFFFSPSDSEEFIRHLSGTKNPQEKYSSFTYSDTESTWFFEIDFNKGHCKYTMTYKRPTLNKATVFSPQP